MKDRKKGRRKGREGSKGRRPARSLMDVNIHIQIEMQESIE